MFFRSAAPQLATSPSHRMMSFRLTWKDARHAHIYFAVLYDMPYEATAFQRAHVARRCPMVRFSCRRMQ
ncbi:hypothetical protein BDI4_250045 [Burkholderia diffusa]|nr:hypothetical protein BDI4_250045 [Burkholderia diffusa]